jgi:hypothetical protein
VSEAVSDEHEPGRRPGVDGPHDEGGGPFDGADCPVRWIIDDVGGYLAGPDAHPVEVSSAGRQAITRAATEVRDLLHSAYSAHEVVATEVRFAGPQRGFRRTVFALSPTPIALMLLCMRTCDAGDDVVVLQHTAGCGSSSRSDTWPFGMERAEVLTRPPVRAWAPALPEGLDDLQGG